jgi:hypothetical protein
MFSPPGFLRPFLLPVSAAAIVSCGGAFAQSTISSVNRHAYAANAGWLDFRPSPADGVVVTETYLAGHAWAGNFGWVAFGDGSPNNGHSYSNASASDCGVNVAPDGSLAGQAWAANVGWIVFEQTHGMPRLDYVTGRIRGHAWAPNLGWLSFEDETSPLATTAIARPDSDADGIPDAWELLHFTKLTFADGTTDHDGDGIGDLEESVADTDPNDAGDRLRIIDHAYADAFTKVTLTFTSRPSRLYRIEHSTGLQPPWLDSDHGVFPPDAGASTARLVKFAAGPRRFFRVLAIRPLEP